MTLPSNWKTQPTTPESEAAAIAIVRQKEGTLVADRFKTWYDNALKKDPKLTPAEAVTIFITGYAIAVGTGKLASFLSGSNFTVTSGGQTVASGSEGPGVAQATVNAASNLPNPLSGLAAIGDFFSRLTNPHTWVRIGEFIVGAALLAIGLNAILKQTTGFSPAGAAVKTAKMVVK